MASLEKGYRSLGEWEKITVFTSGEKKRAIIVVVDSVIYDLREVIPIMAKFEHDAGAVYIARQWPAFVETWNQEKARNKGKEKGALEIMTRLREAAASLPVN